MSKAISKIKFRKSRVESVEKSMSTRTIVTFSEIYFRKLLHFSEISENFPLRKFPAIWYNVLHFSVNILSLTTVMLHCNKDLCNNVTVSFK